MNVELWIEKNEAKKEEKHAVRNGEKKGAKKLEKFKVKNLELPAKR